MFIYEKWTFRKHFLLSFILLYIPLVMFGQECLGVAIIECPDTVGMREEFTYRVTIPEDSTFKELVSPPFDEANIVVHGGPFLNTGSHIQIVNGKYKKTYNRTYSYSLMGMADGVIKIPSYTIKSRLNGNYYTIPQKSIFCRKNDVANNAARKKQKQLEALIKDSLFIITKIDKEIINIDDSVLVTTYMYFTGTLNPTFYLQQTKYPDYCFCNVLQDSVINFERDSINGIECRSAILDRYWLYPCMAKSGIVEIPANSFSIDFLVEDKSADPFERFFHPELAYNEVNIQKTSNTLKLYVNVSPSDSNDNLRNELKERYGTVYALDISGSMVLSMGFSKPKLDLAKSVIKEIAKENATIIPFAGKIEQPVIIPSMMNVLDSIRHPQIDGTALYDLCMSVAMDDKSCHRDIVIFTDGEDNYSHVSLKTVTDYVKYNGVRVNIVIICSNAGNVSCNETNCEQDLIVSKNNHTQNMADLKCLAKETGGQLIELSNEENIKDVIRLIKFLPQKPVSKTKTNRKLDYKRLKQHYLM